MKIATFNKVAMTTDRIILDTTPHISDNAYNLFHEFCNVAAERINKYLCSKLDEAYLSLGIDRELLGNDEARILAQQKGLNLRTNDGQHLGEKIIFQIYEGDTPVSDVFGYSIDSNFQITYF